MWRQPFPIAGAFDDDLVAGVGQAVQCAIAQYGVVEKAEPLVDGAVAGDDEAGLSRVNLYLGGDVGKSLRLNGSGCGRPMSTWSSEAEK